VIYKGKQPIVQEFGPYLYKESDDYSEPQQWDVSTSVPGQSGKSYNAIRMFYNQTCKFDEERAS
jgi:hypothetical protein